MKETQNRTGNRVLSIILAAALITSVWGNPALAGTGNAKDTAVAADKNMPQNPVHHCAKDDAADWSYIYFGSYPQTEVTGRDLTDEVENASYDANGDAVVNNVKYRRIYDGAWEEYHYFKWEKIKWRVLKNEGQTLFIMADSGLDYKKYHEEQTSVTWEDSAIRQWLNDDFYHMAFGAEEQGAIWQQDIVNEGNLEYGIPDGNRTRDRIYLLSAREAVNSEYGFCDDKFTDSQSRQVRPSDYAKTMGLYEENCEWWLRTPGTEPGEAAYVRDEGSVESMGRDVTEEWTACIPVLHVDAESGLWQPENGGSGDMPANPVHHCTKGDITDYSYVYFGSYPQTEITGQALTDEIKTASYDADGDAVVDGVGYRRVNDSYDADYTYYRYYKWEKIRWRVLENNGETLFVLADCGLDCKTYHEKLTNDTWETCSLRQWLNDDFYNTAFDMEEQDAVIEQTVKNEADEECEIIGGNDTQDKVYLLSAQEWQKPAYGYCEEILKSMPASDYAAAMGVLRDFDRSCYWWLRSTSKMKSSAMTIGRWGDLTYDDINASGYACIPALHIDLQSDLWSMEDNGGGTIPGGSTTEEAARKKAAEALTAFLNANKPEGEEADYTAESWEAYQDALTDAQEILEDETASSAQIKAAHKALEDAWNGLEKTNGGGTQITVSKPGDLAVKTGTNAVFGVNASGGNTADITCQWYIAASPTEAGTEIPGADSFIYTLPSVDASYNGKYYYCVVTDGQSSVTSERARLTVYWAPKVTDPKPISVTEGQSATFSVTASGGNPTVYTYQWYYRPSRNSEKVVYIDGATSASYTIPNTTLDMSYRYYGCRVSNGVYSVHTEYAVRLLVNEKPVIKKKQTITAPSSVTIPYGSSKRIHAKTNGDGYLEFKSSNRKIVDTAGSSVYAEKYGTATITVKAVSTTYYKAATKKIKVKVVPKKAALTKVASPGSRRLSLKWKKDKTVTGYEIHLSLKKNFKSKTIKRQFPVSKTGTTVAGFPSGKTYYVRIRSYKKVGKSKYYGAWSKTKKVKIK